MAGKHRMYQDRLPPPAEASSRNAFKGSVTGAEGEKLGSSCYELGSVSDKKSVTLRTHPFFPRSEFKLGLNLAAGKLLYCPDKPYGSYQLRSNLPKVLSLQFSLGHLNSPRLATSLQRQFSFASEASNAPICLGSTQLLVALVGIVLFSK